MTTNGRVVIPKSIRKYFNLKASSKLYFEVNKNNEIEITPVSTKILHK